ncbi:hypothetical protein V8F44DRAFT_632632 [Aspergillus fumigatus]
MPSNKDRLYHWALIVGLKVEAEDSISIRYHTKERLKLGGGSEWFFEDNRNYLVEILRNTPIHQGQLGWNCVFWVKKALETLKVNPKALGTSIIKWEKVRSAHRFDGQGNFNMRKVPTYDLIKRKEIII